MREKWGRAHLPQYPERLQSLSGSLHVADVFFYVVAERQRMEQIYFLLFLLGAPLLNQPAVILKLKQQQQRG